MSACAYVGWETLMTTTDEAIAHLRSVQITGSWVCPTDDDTFYTLAHVLDPTDIFGEVEHFGLNFMGYVATACWTTPDGVAQSKKVEGCASTTWAKIKVEEMLREAGVTILHPTNPES